MDLVGHKEPKKIKVTVPRFFYERRRDITARDYLQVLGSRRASVTAGQVKLTGLPVCWDGHQEPIKGSHGK